MTPELHHVSKPPINYDVTKIIDGQHFQENDMTVFVSVGLSSGD